MSAAKVIAQAVNNAIISFPGWKQPVKLRLIADIGGSGVPTVRTTSTPGVSVTYAGSGVYNITFDPCRDIEDVNPQAYAATPGTAGIRNTGVVDASTVNTNATLGKLSVVFAGADDGVPQDLSSGDVLHVTFWADMG